MRILYLYCHPVPESFHGALRAVALAGLARAGHEVDLCDLYAERFDPVLHAPERRGYHDVAGNRRGLEGYIERLQRADGADRPVPDLVLRPAGDAQGLLRPAVHARASRSTSATRRRVRPMLTNIRRLAGVVTYGRPRCAAWYMGDPPRKLITRYVRWFIAPERPGRLPRALRHQHRHRRRPARLSRPRRAPDGALLMRMLVVLAHPVAGKLRHAAAPPRRAAWPAPATRSARSTSTASASTRCWRRRSGVDYHTPGRQRGRRRATSWTTSAGPRG